jgi:hypothetical protein
MFQKKNIQRLAMKFGCSIGTFPFTYLGLPMGTTRPQFEDLSPKLFNMAFLLRQTSDVKCSNNSNYNLCYVHHKAP